MKVLVGVLWLCMTLLLSATSYALDIPTVHVGNVGNAADARSIDSEHPIGVGSVAYSFNIGSTEISNGQYTAFLNAVAASDPYGLYDANMGTTTFGGIVRNGAAGSFTYSLKGAALNGAYTYDDKPVVYVDWGDAVRFANWLHNGQPVGGENSSTTEDGAYLLNGATTNAALVAVTRKPGARWWLPNEDEWYKAAYHKNNGITGDYWEFPTGTNEVPDNNLPTNDSGNSANFFGSHLATETGSHLG